MYAAQQAFIQEIAESLRLPPLSPECVAVIAPTVHAELVRILTLTRKIHDRCHSDDLISVDEVNLALASQRQEPIYGLHSESRLISKPRSPVPGSGSTSASTQATPTSTEVAFSPKDVFVVDTKVKLVDIARRGLSGGVASSSLSHSNPTASTTTTSNSGSSTTTSSNGKARPETTPGNASGSATLFTPSGSPALSASSTGQLRVPLVPEMRMHWLAVRGTQTKVPENPLVDISDPSTQPPVELTRELQYLYSRIVSVVVTEGRYDLEGGYSRELSCSYGSSSSSSSSDTSSSAVVYGRSTGSSSNQHASSSGVADLSKEDILQTDGHGASAARPMDIVCECVAADAGGMKELAPFLCRFIFVQCKQHSRDYGVMHAILRLTSALMENNTISIKPWLHQILPSLFTCCVGASPAFHHGVSSATSTTSTTTTSSNKISSQSIESGNIRSSHVLLGSKVRQLAGRLIAQIAMKHGATIDDLYPRICKTYLSVLDQNSPVTLPLPAHAPSALAPSNNAGLCCSIYGAVWGLGELGTTAVSILLLPKLDKAWSILTGYNTPGSKDSGGAGGEDSEEARTARALIVHIIEWFSGFRSYCSSPSEGDIHAKRSRTTRRGNYSSTNTSSSATTDNTRASSITSDSAGLASETTKLGTKRRFGAVTESADGSASIEITRTTTTSVKNQHIDAPYSSSGQSSPPCVPKDVLARAGGGSLGDMAEAMAPYWSACPASGFADIFI